jgi:UDP-glucose 4-epimerase
VLSSMRKVFVTGAAGFIGSNLVDRLLKEGCEVIGWDNFSTGQEDFTKEALKSNRFELKNGDNLDLKKLSDAMTGCDFVFHFAANADVRFGLEHPSRDLEQNTLATFHVLEAMRGQGVNRIAFSSTGSVYGEASIFPTPEDAPFPVQTSLYAASKLSGEGMIQAYCEGFGFEGYIFRFVSILGERYTHGHVFDFYKQLKEHPDHLRVLGDGTQRKSYLHIQDCLNAILQVIDSGSAAAAKHQSIVYNLGTDEFCTVRDSIGWICGHLGLSPEIVFTGGKRGWVGDNPFIFLDTRKIRETGWRNQLSIREAVLRTVDWLRENPWVFERRE